MLSMSRNKTAICARLAASATRVKSFRKISVEGLVGGRGRGGAINDVGDGCDEDTADACCDIGDVIGASIFRSECVEFFECCRQVESYSAKAERSFGYKIYSRNSACGGERGGTQMNACQACSSVLSLLF